MLRDKPLQRPVAVAIVSKRRRKPRSLPQRLQAARRRAIDATIRFYLTQGRYDPIAPPLRFAPANNSELELRTPQACMRLLDDQQARLQWLPGNIVDSVTLQLVEAL